MVVFDQQSQETKTLSPTTQGTEFSKQMLISLQLGLDTASPIDTSLMTFESLRVDLVYQAWTPDPQKL